MEAPVRKRQGATDVCVLTDSPENTVKWVSGALINIHNPFVLDTLFFLRIRAKALERRCRNAR